MNLEMGNGIVLMRSYVQIPFFLSEVTPPLCSLHLPIRGNTYNHLSYIYVTSFYYSSTCNHMH